MEEKINYRFWFWSHKLDGILAMLTQLSVYELDDIELEFIKEGLIDTNDELDQWLDYPFAGKKHHLEIKLAYDEQEQSDMIHIQIETKLALKEKLEILNLFQCMFKKLELDE